MQYNPSSAAPSSTKPPDLRPPQASPAPSPRFLSVIAAAAILGTSDVTLYRAIHSSEFPAIKIRGRYVIPAKALDEMEAAALLSGAMVDASAWVDGQGAA
jgi:excisionase family DNA binding protein